MKHSDPKWLTLLAATSTNYGAAPVAAAVEALAMMRAERAARRDGHAE